MSSRDVKLLIGKMLKIEFDQSASLMFRQNTVVQETCTLFRHGILLHVPIWMYTGFVRLVYFHDMDVLHRWKVGIVSSGHISDQEAGVDFNWSENLDAQLTIPRIEFPFTLFLNVIDFFDQMCNNYSLKKWNKPLSKISVPSTRGVLVVWFFLNFLETLADIDIVSWPECRKEHIWKPCIFISLFLDEKKNCLKGLFLKSNRSYD